MGRLLRTLDRLNLASDTIVIYTSDHGDHLSSHGYGKPRDRWMHPSMRASKATPFEESIHVPFLVRFPGRVKANTRTRALLGSVDIMPTLLALAGVAIPEGVQGTDLSHVLLGRDGPRPDSVYLQILGPGWPNRGQFVGFWRGLRTYDWVYARWKDDENGPMLFNVKQDPFEMNNLAGRHEMEAELAARLAKWIKDTKDPFDTGERDPDTGMLKLGQEFIHQKYERS